MLKIYMIINNSNCKHKSRKTKRGCVHNNFNGFNFWAKMHVVIHSKTKLSQFSYRLLQIHLTTKEAMRPVASQRNSIDLHR